MPGMHHRLPLILVRLVERAFVCDPTETELDLDWLNRYWKDGFDVLSLNMRLARHARQLVCLEDCQDMTTLDRINVRLAERIRIRDQQIADKRAKAAASEEPRNALRELPVLTNAEISSENSVADSVSPEVLMAAVEESITRELEGKTAGIKLLEAERVVIRALMEKHGVKAFKTAVVICVQKGLAAWQEEG